jgi:hypothetical protein
MTNYDHISYDIIKVLLVKLCDENDDQFKEEIKPIIDDLEIIQFKYLNDKVICYLMTSQQKRFLIRINKETIDNWCLEHKVSLKPNCSIKLRHDTIRTQYSLQQLRFSN